MYDAQAAILERKMVPVTLIFKTLCILACGIAHQAVKSIEPDGEDVLVLGCGPVGLLAVGIAKALGATKMCI